MEGKGHYLQEELYTLVRKDPQIFEFLQNGSLDGLWYWDLERPSNEWMSPRFWTTLGYDPGSKKHLASEWQDLINPEDLEIALSNFNKHCEDPDHPYDQVVRYTHKDGHTVWVRCRGLAIRDENGRPVRMLGAHTEITSFKKVEEELRESENRFRILFDNAPLPYQSLDENGKFLEVNLRWLDMLGYSREEVVGKSFADFLHPDWINHFKENFPRFKSIGEVLGVEFELRKKDGGYIWVTFDGKIRRDSNGSFMQTHCVFKDITEQRRLEKKVREQEEALRQAQKMESIGTLAGGIAHEFNNILSIIIGNNEIVDDETPDWSPVKGSIDEIRIASLRARDVVKQLLMFGRKDNGNQRPIDIGAVVSETLKLLRSSTPANVEILHDIQENIPFIFANATQINQLLINLCTNARDAMASAGRIEVDLSDIEIDKAKNEIYLSKLKPGHYVKLRVSDNGCGIDSDTIHKIFDPYFTTKEVGKGTGIGLAVVHGIVEKQDGAIFVQSALGKGSEFTILFPVHAGDIEDDVAAENSLPRGDETILLVDDEDSILKLGRKQLERLGYTVIGYTDPTEALNVFSTRPDDFDLVISDMAMPHMTGDRLLQDVLTIRPEIPTMLCTGFSEDFSEKDARHSRIGSFVFKPVSRTEMALSVRKILDEYKGGGG